MFEPLLTEVPRSALWRIPLVYAVCTLGYTCDGRDLGEDVILEDISDELQNRVFREFLRLQMS